VSDTEPEAAFFDLLEGIVGWAATGVLLVLIGSCVIYFT
jgi:hypothetical protein